MEKIKQFFEENSKKPVFWVGVLAIVAGIFFGIRWMMRRKKTKRF